MPNTKEQLLANVTPYSFATIDKEKAREIQKAGGKASVRARRARKTLKEELLLLLKQGDIQEDMCLTLLAQAKRGNIKAFEVIRDTIGEKPVDKQEVEVKDTTIKVTIDDDESETE